ncbi:MAG: lipoprotein-releasing system ATP-binding protein LolD [Flavobacteriales bacterium]|nr:lipoprotein-releasing system ATP-binding protein LolD [Flavobacteriales bacterium]
MLKAENIHKRFGDLEVLKGVSLEVAQGEVVSIVGSSGAGKTTLLQVLGTLSNAESGIVTYDDTEVTKLKAKALADFRNKNIGFIFQFHHLLAEFSALENICMPALIRGESKSEAEAKAVKLLERLNLSHRAEHKPSELSGGEQQRVATARALINQPKVVFADEPSGNLDSKNADELHQLFFDLRDEFKQTFVIVTHNNDLANKCDRKLQMSDGQIVR